MARIGYHCSHEQYLPSQLLCNARLYSRPAHPPLIHAACLTPEMAEWAGSWADGMISVSQEHAQMKEVVDTFHSGGGAGKPVYLQVVLSHAASDEEALPRCDDAVTAGGAR